MDEIDINMGTILITLHSNRVWLLSWFAKESISTRPHRTFGIFCGHFLTVLCGLSRKAHLLNGLQENHYCHTVNFGFLSYSVNDLCLNGLIVLDVNFFN